MSDAKSPLWMQRIIDPKTRLGVRTRTATEAAVRKFFNNQGYQEVRTPLLVESPGMETHMRPWRVRSHASNDRQQAFLPTSPEFAMKKLLAAGCERIFQISPCFRDEPRSKTHLPEFTMLEWYRSGATYHDLMDETETMLREVAKMVTHSSGCLTYQGRTLDFSAPFSRCSVSELFIKHAKTDLARTSLEELRAVSKKYSISYEDKDTWEDLFFRIWLNMVEPNLPADRPCFVYDYPPALAALAEISQTDPPWARRFEVYAGGLELANAFQELCDPLEQKLRFSSDMRARERIYGPEFPASPVDPEFIEALEVGLPHCSGIALGLDRLIMLLADLDDIAHTFFLLPQTSPVVMPDFG